MAIPARAAKHVMSFAVAGLALVSLAGLWAVVNSARPELAGEIITADVNQASIAATAAAPSITNDLPSPRSTPPPAPIGSSSPAATPPAIAQTASLEVVHLHRLGNCRGRLVVTRDGVAFVSEEENEDEAFTLKFAEFLHALSDDTLTLRSATKTYRFKARELPGNGTTQLRELSDRISRARR